MKSTALPIFRSNSSYRRQVVVLIIGSTLIRLILGYFQKLGNDEQYYLTFTVYPEINHFDHAPIIELFIRLLTFDSLFDNKLILRTGSIVLAGFNTWIIYRITCKIKDEAAGWYAALFYTFSIYGSIIIGISIIPETVQLFFWLLCISLMVDFLPARVIDKKERLKMILFGCFVSLAILSKYSSAFIWLSTISFIMIFNRKWLRELSLYTSLFISFFFILPILNWKLEYDWPGFSLLTETINFSHINWNHFFNEILYGAWYVNPFNLLLIVIPLVSIFRGKILLDSHLTALFLLTILPLYITSVFFLFFNINWLFSAGPVFITLSIPAAVYWSDKIREMDGGVKQTLLSLYALGSILVIAPYVFNYQSRPEQKLNLATTSFAEFDIVKDFQGWTSIREGFQIIANKEEAKGNMPLNSDLIASVSFPCAHEAYYVAHPMQRKLFLLSDKDDTMMMRNNVRIGGLKNGQDYYYITISTIYENSKELLEDHFDKIELIDTIRITPSYAFKRYSSYALVYRVKTFQQE